MNVLYLFDKMAGATVDHNDCFVPIKGGLFQMLGIKVRFIELIASVLVEHWVVHSSLKHSVLIIHAELAHAGSDQALVGFPVEFKVPGEFVRVKHIQTVTVKEGIYPAFKGHA